MNGSRRRNVVGAVDPNLRDGRTAGFHVFEGDRTSGATGQALSRSQQEGDVFPFVGRQRKAGFPLFASATIFSPSVAPEAPDATPGA
jgi:hypothetical protein